MNLLATSIIQRTHHLSRLQSLLLHCMDYVIVYSNSVCVGNVYVYSLSTAIQWNETPKHDTSTLKSSSSAFAWK